MAIAVIAPGATTAGDTISLPSGAPAIDKVVSAFIFRGSDASAAASIVTCTATKASETAITLDVDTTTRDIIILYYVAKGEKV